MVHEYTFSAGLPKGTPDTLLIGRGFQMLLPGVILTITCLAAYLKRRC